MKTSLLSCIALLTGILTANAQNAPFALWGAGLDGSLYQQSVFYSDATNGLLIEAPLSSTSARLPISFNWRGGGPSPFFIHPNSNVGIGTSSPQSTLHVYQSSANSTGLIIQGNTISADNVPHYIAMTLDGDYGNATGNYSQIRSYSNLYSGWGSQLTFHTSQYGVANTLAERMRIDANGNVGIGTASPTTKLQLGDFNNGAASNQLVIPGTYNFEQMRLGQTGNGNMALELVNHTGVASSYGVRFLVNVDSGAPGLQLQCASPTTDYTSLSYNTGLYMNLSGNIAIGTTTVPSGYKFAVNGSMIATSVYVKAYTDWPDYIFDKGHTLMSPAELKNYVDKNKHLPEIPSAAEVKQNGQDLGEMNKMLLKKVEELTLYMIEQNKRIENLEEALKTKNK